MLAIRSTSSTLLSYSLFIFGVQLPDPAPLEVGPFFVQFLPRASDYIDNRTLLDPREIDRYFMERPRRFEKGKR